MASPNNEKRDSFEIDDLIIKKEEKHYLYGTLKKAPPSLKALAYNTPSIVIRQEKIVSDEDCWDIVIPIPAPEPFLNSYSKESL